MGQLRAVAMTDLTLRCDRLLLRPRRVEDVPEIVEAMRSGAQEQVLSLPDPYTEADAIDVVSHAGQVERWNASGLQCAVVEHRSGRVVGSATLRPSAGSRGADIGLWIAPSARRNGYATETAVALAQWAFGHGAHRLELRLDPTNLAAARVGMRAGFTFEGLRRDALPRSGALFDMAVFVRTADDPGTPIAPAFPMLPDGELTDGTLRLRGMHPRDIDAFAEQEADDHTIIVGFTGRTPSRRAMERLLARAGLDLLVGQVAGFAMVDAATDAFAGSIRVRVTGPPNVGGVGYAVHPAFRGRSYTTRALRLLARWAFELGDFARLELGAKIDNIASQRAALSAGFVPDGIWRARLRNADGTFSDEARFCLVNPLFR